VKTINLARGLTLPAAELATEVVASLGQRGSGKSNGAGVIAEGLLAAGVQVIVLDHVGIWWALRMDETGKHSSPYEVPVLGGQHGDLPLVATTGAVVAEALARSGSSAVLDVSAFSKGDRCRFAADFAESFFAAKKLHPGPVQILLEEAQRYVPQKLFAGQGLERMLGAFEEIAEVGRNYGVGLHLISQRPQKINKDVLNLADTVLAYRANGVLERKAISDWVQEKGAEGRKEMHNELPGLPRGTAIVWSPNREIYDRFAIIKKSTYDAGATPTHARAAVKTKRLDLDSLESAMGKAVEEAKANDPRALNAEIERLKKSGTAPALEREVGRLRIELEREKEKNEQKISKSVLKEADIKRIEKVIGKLANVGAKSDEWMVRITEKLLRPIGDWQARIAGAQEAAVTASNDLRLALAPARNSTTPPPVLKGVPDTGIRYAPPPRQVRATAPGRRETDAATDTGDLPQYALDLLNVLAQRGKASDAQISTLSGYRRTSSAFPKMLGKLTAAGLIAGAPRERVITDAGRERAGTVAALPTGRALLDHWLSKLTGYERLFLQTIHDAGTITREDLAAQTGRSLGSSAFPKTIGALVRLALVEAPRGGDLTIAESFR
jgi:hypothetical protein